MEYGMGGTTCVTSNASGITKANATELEGKKVAVPLGTMAEYVFDESIKDVFSSVKTSSKMEFKCTPTDAGDIEVEQQYKEFEVHTYVRPLTGHQTVDFQTSDAANATELEGKKVAVPLGTMAEYVFDESMKVVGADRKN